MLQYLIKFSISLAVLYVFYRAVLRPLTFYQCNRFYLLCYSLLSFVIPFINIASWVPAQGNDQLLHIIPAIGNYSIAENSHPAMAPSGLQSITLTDGLLILFCTGTLVMLVKIMLQYCSLRSIRRKAVLVDTGSNIQLYETSAVVSPFSFGNAIYFNRRLHTAEELQRIIQHEFVHVKQKHTIDLLAGELLCVFNWFNPFAWLIRYSIRQNLEFIADNKVLANGLGKKEYQYLLLKVVGISQYRIASHFNFSNLKTRIAMMNKMKTSKLHLAKFIFVLPLMAVLFLAFRKNEKEKINSPDAAMVNKQSTDTVPAPPPSPVKAHHIPESPVTANPGNKKGYIITIADDNGECIVLVKDSKQHMLKAITLTDWNKNKKEHESLYGQIPPPPPPPPVRSVAGISEAPVAPEMPVISEMPLAPARPSVIKLPPHVKGISIHTDINDKASLNINTATVTLKNGNKEVYNLNDPKEKAAFIKKYGELPASPPAPPLPAIEGPVPSPAPAVRINPVAGIVVKGIAQPLYIADGVANRYMVNANNTSAGKIKSIQVAEDKYAIDKYGDKRKNGVVEISAITPVTIADSVIQR